MAKTTKISGRQRGYHAFDFRTGMMFRFIGDGGQNARDSFVKSGYGKSLNGSDSMVRKYHRKGRGYIADVSGSVNGYWRNAV